MQRLNSAMRRKSAVDSAIDLGIALESIFLRDTTDDRSELTFKLRVRASRWLGATPEERGGLSALLRDLYAARSSAVHRGYVSDSIRGKPTHELLEEGHKLAAGALVRLIETGNPNWDVVTYG